MLREALLMFTVLAGSALTGCTQGYIDKIVRKSVTEYRHQIQQAEAEKSILKDLSLTEEADAAVITPDEISRPNPAPLIVPSGQQGTRESFSDRYFGELLALLSLFSIWLVVRLHKPQRQSAPGALDAEAQAMIRIIKDTATDLWGKYNPRRNVIDLTTWRKRR